MFVGWSARAGVWDRFQQVLLGALPEGGPPIRVATHIDLRDGISPSVIDKFDTEYLYVYSLSAGVGSNDIGLDRGQLGSEQIVKFDRRGQSVAGATEL